MHGERWRGRESGGNSLPHSEAGEGIGVSYQGEDPGLEIQKLKTEDTSPTPALTLGEGHQGQRLHGTCPPRRGLRVGWEAFLCVHFCKVL